MIYQILDITICVMMIIQIEQEDTAIHFYAYLNGNFVRYSGETIETPMYKLSQPLLMTIGDCGTSQCAGQGKPCNYLFLQI